MGKSLRMPSAAEKGAGGGHHGVGKGTKVQAACRRVVCGTAHAVFWSLLPGSVRTARRPFTAISYSTTAPGEVSRTGERGQGGFVGLWYRWWGGRRASGGGGIQGMEEDAVKAPKGKKRQTDHKGAKQQLQVVIVTQPSAPAQTWHTRLTALCIVSTSQPHLHPPEEVSQVDLFPFRGLGAWDKLDQAIRN